MILHLAIIALSTRKRLERQCQNAAGSWSFRPAGSTKLCFALSARLPFHQKAKLGFNRTENQYGLSILSPPGKHKNGFMDVLACSRGWFG
jgi:hypothetical protein